MYSYLKNRRHEKGFKLLRSFVRSVEKELLYIRLPSATKVYI